MGGNRYQVEAGRYVDSGVSTGKFRGFTYSIDLRQKEVIAAVERVPSLLNPAVSNRFAFGKAKAVLTDKFGSQKAAIGVMKLDPSLLQAGDALEEMSKPQILATAYAKQLVAVLPPVLLAGSAVAYAFGQGGLPTEVLPEALQQLLPM